MKYFIITLSILSLMVLKAGAHTNVELVFSTDDGSKAQNMEIIVQKADSTVLFEIVNSEKYILPLLKPNTYSLSVTAQGYSPFLAGFSNASDTTINILLNRESRNLDELVVKGRLKSKTTADGEIFRLSKKAKECSDPFLALSEIPLLEVDVINQSVKVVNGSGTPLVLIDGKLVNSGIKPVDPKFIESVKITEVASAKYLEMGYDKIIDIRLKRDVPTYIYTELRTRHDIPLREGFGGANFEVGRKTFAISGDGFMWYKHNDVTKLHSLESQGKDWKESSGENFSDMTKPEGSLMLKWVPLASDYFAARVAGTRTRSNAKGHASGKFGDESGISDLRTDKGNSIIDGGWLACLFHEHTFSDKSTISTFAKYNRGFYDINEWYGEYRPDSDSIMREHQKSRRNQYTLTIDYNSGDRGWWNMSAGNKFEYTSDKNRDFTQLPIPTSKVTTNNNYTHAAISASKGRFYGMASAGLQYLGVNAVGIRSSSWRPRASASLTLKIPRDMTLRASYILDNRLPDNMKLFSFNNSTNPWLRIEGNPYLKPEILHKMSVSLGKSWNRVYLRGYVDHYRYAKMIERYMRQEGDVTILSYRNNGTYRATEAGLMLNLRFGKFACNTNAAYTTERYSGQHDNGSIYLRGIFQWTFGKFLLHSVLEWRNKYYNAVSFTKYSNPTEAMLMLSWKATKTLQVAVGMPYFWGIRKETTLTDGAGYHGENSISYKSASLRPWILISWTLRKNSELSIRNKMPEL